MAGKAVPYPLKDKRVWVTSQFEELHAVVANRYLTLDASPEFSKGHTDFRCCAKPGSRVWREN